MGGRMTGSAASDTRYIDPDMPAAWDRMRDIAAEHGLDGPRHVLTPDEKRKRAELERRWWNEDRPDLAEIVDITVPTPSPDAPGNSVPVRLLYPNHQDPILTIVYLHGAAGWSVSRNSRPGDALSGAEPVPVSLRSTTRSPRRPSSQALWNRSWR